MNFLHIPIRVKLTEMEFLRSVFSINTVIYRENNNEIHFVINNNPSDELKFEEWISPPG